MQNVLAQKRTGSILEAQGGPVIWLLQLPESALDLVLQKLDPCSLASTAVSCSKLSSAIPAHMSQVVVRCSSTVDYDNLISWLNQRSSNLVNMTSLTQRRLSTCWKRQHLGHLPCSQLHQLILQGMDLQLEPTFSSSGLLQDVTGLAALDLEDCLVENMPAAFTAISALPKLRHLRLMNVRDKQGGFLISKVHPMLELTHLSLDMTGRKVQVDPTVGFLGQLAATVNLQHLSLDGFPASSLSDSWPCQLSKLISLRIRYSTADGAAQHLQHISCLAALQELDLSCTSQCTHDAASEALSGIAHLLQLTNLRLDILCHGDATLNFTTVSTFGWACRTALQSLDLSVSA
jgi:hypothetical protein